MLKTNFEWSADYSELYLNRKLGILVDLGKHIHGGDTQKLK